MPFEEKSIQINIFESTQFDFKPEKPKKRRKGDDYDYNDPFIEPFEGEFDPVELECKLENFFIYKGKMDEDPKRIARKYNNTVKKQKMVESLQNSTQEGVVKTTIFDFEDKLEKLINKTHKYKKDIKFDNLIIWIVKYNWEYLTKNEEFKWYLIDKILLAYKKEGINPTGYSKDVSDDQKTVNDDQKVVNDGKIIFNDQKVEYENFLDDLKDEIEKIAQNLNKITSDSTNFSNEMKFFNQFKNESYLDDMIKFIIKYVVYYSCKTEKNIKHVRGLAIEYLTAMFPESCTNKFKLKYYIFKKVEDKMKSLNFDTEKVLNGEFVHLETNNNLDSTNISSNIDSFNPSFNENSISIGSDFPISSGLSNSNSLYNNSSINNCFSNLKKSYQKKNNNTSSFSPFFNGFIKNETQEMPAKKASTAKSKKKNNDSLNNKSNGNDLNLLDFKNSEIDLKLTDETNFNSTVLDDDSYYENQ